MGAVRDIALDLAPIAGILVLLLGIWVGAAALSLRSPAASRRIRAEALGTGPTAHATARPGVARLPGQRDGSEAAQPADGSAAKR